tara:strand:+ start:938 stop:1414 length:477 start_codon:yes stop_codon:yes gene_type:complete
MKVTIRKKISTKKLINFINTFDDKVFSNNKSLKNPPWKYLKEKKFNFYYLFSNNEAIGSIVVLNTKYSRHLSFFYIIRRFRNKGIGSIFLKKVFLNLSKKKMKTVHVDKRLKKTIKFYKKNSFIVSNKKENNIIKKWIKRCLIFDKNTYRYKHLMFVK